MSLHFNSDCCCVVIIGHKIRLYGRRGKDRAEFFSREKLSRVPQKEGGEILCDPGGCVHTSDVQNKWDDNTHTHVTSIIDPPLGGSMRVA